MSRNTNQTSVIVCLAGLVTLHCAFALPQSFGQSPPTISQPTKQPQPSSPANAVDNNTLALPVIAEPQRVRVGDARLMTVNLFGQERDTFDQVREAQQAAASTVPPAPGTPRPEVAAAPAPAVADINLLRQTGIVLANPITGRLIVERVLPNSAAFAAGVRPGDIISRIDRTPLAVSNPLRPAVVSAGGTIGLDIERHGQTGRLVLNMTEPVVTGPVATVAQRTAVPVIQTMPAPVLQTAPAPVVQTTAAPIVQTVPAPVVQTRVPPAVAPVLRSAVAPITTPSGRVIESIPVPANAPAPLDHATIAGTKVLAPGSGSTTGPGVSGIGDKPQGPGTPGLGSAPSEGGGSAAMRTGRNAPVKPGQGYGTGRLY
jgi:hypothetical protein